MTPEKFEKITILALSIKKLEELLSEIDEGIHVNVCFHHGNGDWKSLDLIKPGLTGKVLSEIKDHVEDKIRKFKKEFEEA